MNNNITTNHLNQKSIKARDHTSKKNELYFKIHVGDDNPAEVHHLDMTVRLLKESILPEKEAEFLSKFRDAYNLNITWCKTIKNVIAGKLNA